MVTAVWQPVEEAWLVHEVDFLFLLFSQAYVNMVSGCCLAMGLRYAGTCDQMAYQCLVSGTVSHDIT